MIEWGKIEYLYFLIGLIPLLLAIFWFGEIFNQKIMNKFADKNLHSTIMPKHSIVKKWIKHILILLSIIFLFIALANPRIGTELKEVDKTGIDVFILLDVSNSMMAEDIKPSRLEKAKYQISNLINILQGDRIGLIIFAGQAYVQIPLTIDYSAANLFLSAVDVNSIPSQGTAIASAINLATASFDSLATDKVIITITDGEDHEGDVMDAVENATSKGIRIYTIGLGSPGGVPIPMYNRNGQLIGFKKDQSGNTVLSKLDEQSLKEIAIAGNGKYFRGTNYEDYLDQIYTELSELEKTEFGKIEVIDYDDKYTFWIIAVGLIFIIIELFITNIKSPLYARINKKLGLEQ